MASATIAPVVQFAKREDSGRARLSRHGELLVLLFASIIFLTSLISPPRLMDDEDAARAQISRNMIQSGDWITPHLNGVRYFEKPPLQYWLVALSLRIFGDTDTAARVPTCLVGILLCWMVARIAGTALGARAGLFAGLSFTTSIGLWLFTRILIPDAALTLAAGWSIWSFFRALEKKEVRWRLWAISGWISVAAALLLKGFVGAVLPFGAILLYLVSTGLWRERETWRRLWLVQGAALTAVIAAPWYIAATLRNPPFLDFSLHSTPGVYRGFFWYHLFNEQILRFLNRRYPLDYNTVPRLWFWLLHLAWLFPWSAFLFPALRLDYRGADQSSRMRRLALCWIAAVMGFFTLSTTQEYYSMPAYPAFALLIGSAMAEAGTRTWSICMRVTGAIAAVACAAIALLLWASWGYANQGDISQALNQNAAVYTLSLGHMGDLTVRSFAWLRTPLIVAGFASLLGAFGTWLFSDRRAAISIALMMVLFFQAARLALLKFDPYLGSYSLAQSLNRAPAGGLIVDDPYYEFSSLLFYANRTGTILNGRVNNLEYGSYAPGGASGFIGDAGFVKRWRSAERWYVASEDVKLKHLVDLVGTDALHLVVSSGGKTIWVNR